MDWILQHKQCLCTLHQPTVWCFNICFWSGVHKHPACREQEVHERLLLLLMIPDEVSALWQTVESLGRITAGVCYFNLPYGGLHQNKYIQAIRIGVDAAWFKDVIALVLWSACTVMRFYSRGGDRSTLQTYPVCSNYIILRFLQIQLSLFKHLFN